MHASSWPVVNHPPGATTNWEASRIKPIAREKSYTSHPCLLSWAVLTRRFQAELDSAPLATPAIVAPIGSHRAEAEAAAH